MIRFYQDGGRKGSWSSLRSLKSLVTFMPGQRFQADPAEYTCDFRTVLKRLFGISCSFLCSVGFAPKTNSALPNYDIRSLTIISFCHCER